MNDRQILDLFFERSQDAVAAVREQYGEQLTRLAENILDDRRDAEECVSDALMKAWNSIPPQRPEPLLPWLYTTVRRTCMNRYRINRAQKRGRGYWEALEELSEAADQSGGPAQEVELAELTTLLERFVKRLPRRDQRIFLGRYWYGEAYDTIALRLGMTTENCRVRMGLIRKKLRNYLKKEGAL